MILKKRKNNEFWTKHNIFYINKSNEGEPEELGQELVNLNINESEFDFVSEANNGIFEIESFERAKYSEYGSDFTGYQKSIKRSSFGTNRDLNSQPILYSQNELNINIIIVLQRLVKKWLFKRKLLALYKG
mmetsp:Transcript_2742/g.2295  ORF Transcript_2742/g.2295 Transcript_2742/m.2295 type:complete len:131 (-) Transcript_2742:945-1337(-)